MRVRLRGVLATVAIAIGSVSIAHVAAAQTTTNQSDDPPLTVQEAALDAYYSNSGTFFRNRRLDRQVDWILGTGTNFLNSFPDNEIAGDGRAIDRFYREALRQQTLGDGIIRTPDLENPFGTSLLLLPASSATLSNFDSIPPVPVVPFSPPPAPEPQAAPPPAAPSRPVPALW